MSVCRGKIQNSSKQGQSRTNRFAIAPTPPYRIAPSERRGEAPPPQMAASRAGRGAVWSRAPRQPVRTPRDAADWPKNRAKSARNDPEKPVTEVPTRRNPRVRKKPSCAEPVRAGGNSPIAAARQRRPHRRLHGHRSGSARSATPGHIAWYPLPRAFVLTQLASKTLTLEPEFARKALAAA